MEHRTAPRSTYSSPMAEAAMRANAILAKLHALTRQRMARRGLLQTFKPGEVLCHQGAPAVRFWLVLSGQVKLVTYTSKGLQLLIDIVLPNQIFGAVLYEDNPLYPSTALAMRGSELISFRLQDLTEDLEHNAALQKLLLTEMFRKLCRAEYLRVLSLERAPIRIAQLLLQLHERFGTVIPETRSTLAELAGTSVETAIRITKTLHRRGILNVRRGRIEIRSLARLRACALDNASEI